VSMRRAGREWSELSEELCTGVETFSEASIRLRVGVQAAQGVSRERITRLKGLLQDMGIVFQASLKMVNESGSALLTAAGDLQRNRDTVFEVVPRSSKGCRQAAEELLNCRNAILQSVQTNGEVLIGMREQLGPAHKAVLKALREASAALSNAREAFRRESELLQFAQARNLIAEDLAQDLGKGLAASLRAITKNGKELEAIAESLATTRQAYRRAVVVNRNAIRQAEASLRRDQDRFFASLPWVSTSPRSLLAKVRTRTAWRSLPWSRTSSAILTRMPATSTPTTRSFPRKSLGQKLPPTSFERSCCHSSVPSRPRNVPESRRSTELRTKCSPNSWWSIRCCRDPKALSCGDAL